MRLEFLLQFIVPLTFLAIWALTSLLNRDAQPLPPRPGAGRGPGMGPARGGPGGGSRRRRGPSWRDPGVPRRPAGRPPRWRIAPRRRGGRRRRPRGAARGRSLAGHGRRDRDHRVEDAPGAGFVVVLALVGGIEPPRYARVELVVPAGDLARPFDARADAQVDGGGTAAGLDRAGRPGPNAEDEQAAGYRPALDADDAHRVAA